MADNLKYHNEDLFVKAVKDKRYDDAEALLNEGVDPNMEVVFNPRQGLLLLFTSAL